MFITFAILMTIDALPWSWFVLALMAAFDMSAIMAGEYTTRRNTK